MEGLERRPRLLVHRGERIDDGIDEAIGRGQADVERVVVIMLDAAIFGRVRRIDQAIGVGLRRLARGQQARVANLHRLDRGAAVTRHIDRRNDLDLPRRCRLHDRDIVGGSQVTIDRARPVGTGAELRQQARLFLQVVAPFRPDLGQFGQRRNLDPPAFVVGEMEVQLVQLIRRHRLDQFQDLVAAMEIAAQIDVQPAKAIFGGVHHPQRLHPALLKRRLLRKRAQRVAGARRVARGDRDARRLDVEHIALGLCRGGGIDPDRQR